MQKMTRKWLNSSNSSGKNLCFGLTGSFQFRISTWILVLGAMFIVQLENAAGATSSPEDAILAEISTPTGFHFFAEIADSPDERAKGLMNRTSLEPDRGMLFQFPELGYWTFWMKNTRIPLDIIWLDRDGTILHIESDVPICTRTDDHCPRYYSYKKSWQVLEVNAGMAKKYNLLAGHKLKISLPPDHIPYPGRIPR